MSEQTQKTRAEVVAQLGYILTPPALVQDAFTKDKLVEALRAVTDRSLGLLSADLESFVDRLTDHVIAVLLERAQTNLRLAVAPHRAAYEMETPEQLSVREGISLEAAREIVKQVERDLETYPSPDGHV